MNSDLTFDLIEKLIAVAIIFQTLELIAIRQVFSDEGVWRWSTLSKEFKVFSRVSQCVFTFFLGYRNFCILLFARLILALTLFFVSSPLVLVSLLISTILISLRWRGTFNGGSDYVTVLVLYSLTFASFFRDHLTVENAVLWYITIQISSSYFIGGIVKLKSANWRSGKAIKGFFSSTIYHNSKLLESVLQSRAVVLFISWSIILFEILFVVSLLNPHLCLIVLSFAFLFHLANFYIFGLNRFLFSWVACYPAVYYCSGLT